MIARKTSGTPWPVLALTARISSGSMPSVCMISSLISSGRAACMSILFRTGTMARSLPTARIGIGHRLGLHALGRVHQQDGAFAGRQAAGNLVVKVHVPRRVDQIQLVGLAVERVIDRHGASLDGDSTLALKVHVIKQLLAELALGDRTGLEQQLVGQRALAVVDVSDDRKIADVFGVKDHARNPGGVG